MNNTSALDTTKNIKPINNDTVHKICSGQVVLSLAVAVKELVENSLDAGATNIDIRLKNYGVDLIEVSDNGSGITEDNFIALTMKYHTSKLNDYSDLLGVSSFGFRGEALSSLCELANLTVTTRHSSADYATKIEYDNKGNIIKKTLCSRQVGTTVNLTNLFHSLPVRQKEFHKNVKREFNKMTQLLYAYCLISVGVKITCTNNTSSNAKSIVVATQGSFSYKDNIGCIFGLKQLQTILEVNPEYVPNIKENIFNGLSQEIRNNDDSVQIEDIEIDLSEDSNENETDAKSNAVNKSQGYKNVVKPVEFTGFISSCEHGSGRSSTDRQFFYVNSRPCEPTKVIKLINEIYRQHNPNQYPFVFLNINTDRTSVDVNVTPDKRKVFLIKEKNILDVLKNSLLKLFENVPRTLKVDTSLNAYYKTNDLKPDVDHPRIFNSFLQQFGNKSKSVIESKNIDMIKTDLKRKSTSMLDFISSKTIKTESSKYEHLVEQFPMPTEVHNEAHLSVMKIDRDNENKQHPTLKKSPDSSEYIAEQDVSNSINSLSDNPTETFQDNENKQQTTLKKSPDSSECLEQDVSVSNNKFSNNLTENKNESILYLEYSDNLPNTQIRNLSDVVFEDSHKIYCKPKAQNVRENIVKQTKSKSSPKDIVTDKEDLGKGDRRSIILKTSLEHVKALTNSYVNKKDKLIPTKVRFKGGINPVFNKKCEEELTKEISKESFKQMKIVGQFNLGFIITRLDDDLFIIDQHATDEIYNFEILQKTTELTSQKLVIPQPLELAGVNEQILMDNIDIFKKNGFTFAIDQNAPPTKRVKLLTLPMSKNWIFSKDDIEELLFMLRESPSEHCRPSRVRAMFASRACRKSVMIGTALKKSDMRVLVDHMAEIDKPWNCPHGRPTIRHLVNLAMIQTKNNCD